MLDGGYQFSESSMEYNDENRHPNTGLPDRKISVVGFNMRCLDDELQRQQSENGEIETPVNKGGVFKLNLNKLDQNEFTTNEFGKSTNKRPQAMLNVLSRSSRSDFFKNIDENEQIGI